MLECAWACYGLCLRTEKSTYNDSSIPQLHFCTRTLPCPSPLANLRCKAFLVACPRIPAYHRSTFPRVSTLCRAKNTVRCPTASMPNEKWTSRYAGALHTCRSTFHWVRSHVLTHASVELWYAGVCRHAILHAYAQKSRPVVCWSGWATNGALTRGKKRGAYAWKSGPVVCWSARACCQVCFAPKVC